HGLRPLPRAPRRREEGGPRARGVRARLDLLHPRSGRRGVQGDVRERQVRPRPTPRARGARMRRAALVVLAMAGACGACGESSSPGGVDAEPTPAFCKAQSPAPQACEDFDDPSFDVATRVVRTDDGAAKLVARERGQALSFATVAAPGDAGAKIFYFLD